MAYLYFDIETRPLPDNVLLDMWGYPEPMEDPGEFDPASVKLGNASKPDAVKKKIDAAREKHAALVDEYRSGGADILQKHIKELRSKGTLCPDSGEIVTIGRKYNGMYVVPDASESDQLCEWWEVFEYHRNRGNTFVGFNIKEFDMPWIVCRSFVHGLKIPLAVIDKERYWHPSLVDLMTKWACGAYGFTHKPSLHRLAISMGHQGKNRSGSDFYRLWEDDREQAIEYVKHDLDLTELCATRMLRIV